MKTINFFYVSLLAFMMTGLSGCDLVGDIFEAGAWVGIIIVVLVIVLIGWIIRKMRG